MTQPLGWPAATVLVAMVVSVSFASAYVATAETRAQTDMMESLSQDPCLVVLFTASMRDEQPPVAEYRECRNATEAPP